jgi:hypothetical protein
MYAFVVLAALVVAVDAAGYNSAVEVSQGLKYLIAGSGMVRLDSVPYLVLMVEKTAAGD